MRHFPKIHLPDRQCLQSLVAKDTDIKLAAIYVLFHQDIRAGLLMDKFDALVELCLVVDD